MLKEIRENSGMLLSKKVVEVPSEPSGSSKMKTRLKIQDEVFDNADSIADNAKMISLLTTMLSRMYDIFTDTQKNKLAAEDKAMIEYMFTKFATTNTRADIQFATEGQGMIDKILDRQAQIGAIIK